MQTIQMTPHEVYCMMNGNASSHANEALEMASGHADKYLNEPIAKLRHKTAEFEILGKE